MRVRGGIQSYSNIYNALPNFLKESHDYLLSKGLHAINDNSTLKFYDNLNKLVAEISEGQLIFKYSGFGGDIVMTQDKTTAIFGRFNDPVHGGGTSEFINTTNPIYQTGENINGIALLNLDDWTWLKNKKWIIESDQRADIIRFISDPTDPINIYKNGVNGEKTVTGLEIDVLENLGYVWDESRFVFFKP